jgi:hypothetical protein
MFPELWAARQRCARSVCPSFSGSLMVQKWELAELRYHFPQLRQAVPFAFRD